MKKTLLDDQRLLKHKRNKQKKSINFPDSQHCWNQSHPIHNKLSHVIIKEENSFGADWWFLRLRANWNRMPSMSFTSVRSRETFNGKLFSYQIAECN